jgi:methane monooxygenase PmoA-like
VNKITKNANAFWLLVCLALPVCQIASGTAQKTTYVTVEAGSLDRRETVVSFALPKDLRAKSYALHDETGSVLPLQVDESGQATFVLTGLKAGATKRYRLAELKPGSQPPTRGVELVKEREGLTINAAGRRVLGYRAQAGELPSADIKPIFKRGGYIHPVYTPSGRIITDDYPPDHYHHHGIWFAWTKTEFQGRHPDFWNMGDGTGAVEFVALDQTWSGAVHAGFTARHRYVDLSGGKATTVLNEQWKVIVYGVGQGEKPYTMFDLISTHECATASALILPEYRYGGVGFRGHRDWLDKNNCFFLTSEDKDRANGNATRGRWCHIGGRIGGQMAGIVILDHPANFRAPQPMRLNPDQPFFCFAPSQMGQWEIAPGKSYISRYRFVVYDGSPDKAELDRFWNDYANPPQVKITLR